MGSVSEPADRDQPVSSVCLGCGLECFYLNHEPWDNPKNRTPPPPILDSNTHSYGVDYRAPRWIHSWDAPRALGIWLYAGIGQYSKPDERDQTNLKDHIKKNMGRFPISHYSQRLSCCRLLFGHDLFRIIRCYQTKNYIPAPG